MSRRNSSDQKTPGFLYRVWCIVNQPNQPVWVPVQSPYEGYRLIQDMADMQLENEGIHSNAFGLEAKVLGMDWEEWYNEHGQDVDEAFISMEIEHEEEA